MINRVQNYQAKPVRLAFKAKENSNSDVNRDLQKPVYKTHAGLKTSVGYIGFIGLVCFSVQAVAKSIKKFSENAMKDMGNEMDAVRVKNINNSLKSLGFVTKNLKYSFPISILIGLGCGALVDKKINDKHAQMANKLEKEGKKAVLESDNRAELTKNDNVYYNSNIGKKLGPLLGLAVTASKVFISSKVYKLKLPAMAYAEPLIEGALGGLILGAITDNVSNKGAAKFVDKQNAEV